MNYPRIFERVYCQPLCVTEARFRAIHSVLLPRLRAGLVTADAGALVAAAPAPSDPRPPRPTTSPYSGKRQQRVGPKVDPWTGKVLDDRFFSVPAPGLACIPIYGVLAKNLSAFEEDCGGGTDTTPIGFAVQQAFDDPTVAGLLLDIDSPGGEVTGIPELAELIGASPKPVYAFCDAACCSAAYWLASAADEIYCTQSAQLGSIGTYLAWLDETVALQLAGLKLELFVGDDAIHKAMGLPGNPLKTENRVLLQERVDALNGWFTGAVAAARPDVTPDTMQGQSFSGAEAVQRGLADGLVSGFDELVTLIAATLADPVAV